MSQKSTHITDLFGTLPTPSYIIDENVLRHNGEILASVDAHTGCKILLAQKAFSNYDFYPLLSGYLSGTEASGLYEARLGAEEMPDKEVHVFCGAYRDDEFEELLTYADHIVFNSPHQFKKFAQKAKAAGKSIGLRINPECSTQDGHAIYDPCAPGSRLGTTRAVWNREMTGEWISLLDGLHFHTLCEQNSDDLKTTLDAVEEKFGKYMHNCRWINMGGGHHITREDYDVRLLIDCVRHVQDTYHVKVYLEPGEAVALNAGYLVTEVLDKVDNGIETLILDASAACHMPDVLEMPYTPPLYGAQIVADILKTQEAPKDAHFVYRLSSYTCLAGDIIGDYEFDHEINVGDRLIFMDMAIYSMVKNNTFNGMPLPSISVLKDGKLSLIKSFGYEDFKCRL